MRDCLNSRARLCSLLVAWLVPAYGASWLEATRVELAEPRLVSQTVPAGGEVVAAVVLRNPLKRELKATWAVHPPSDWGTTQESVTLASPPGKERLSRLCARVPQTAPPGTYAASVTVDFELAGAARQMRWELPFAVATPLGYKRALMERRWHIGGFETDAGHWGIDQDAQGSCAIEPSAAHAHSGTHSLRVGLNFPDGKLHWGFAVRKFDPAADVSGYVELRFHIRIEEPDPKLRLIVIVREAKGPNYWKNGILPLDRRGEFDCAVRFDALRWGHWSHKDANGRLDTEAVLSVSVGCSQGGGGHVVFYLDDVELVSDISEH